MFILPEESDKSIDNIRTNNFHITSSFLQIWYIMSALYLWNVPSSKTYTVKPVCNDHIYDKIYYLWFIQ